MLRHRPISRRTSRFARKCAKLFPPVVIRSDLSKRSDASISTYLGEPSDAYPTLVRSEWRGLSSVRQPPRFESCPGVPSLIAARGGTREKHAVDARDTPKKKPAALGGRPHVTAGETA